MAKDDDIQRKVLNELNLKEKLEKLEKISNIIAVVISVIALVISIWSIHHSFSLTEPYLIPRDPTLRFWINSQELIPSFTRFHITSENNFVSVCAFNDGRAVSGHIYFNFIGEMFVGDGVNIDYIEGGNGTCVSTRLRAICKEIQSGYPFYNPCNETQTKTQIPLGKQKVNLQYECIFCKPRIQNVTLDICIWEDKTRDCP